MTATATSSVRLALPRRLAWGALALFVAAFAVFEVAKHGGAAFATAPLGLLIPFAHRWLRHGWLPFALMVLVAVGDQSTAYFILGLTWLLHVAVRGVIRRRATP